MLTKFNIFPKFKDKLKQDAVYSTITMPDLQQKKSKLNEQGVLLDHFALHEKKIVINQQNFEFHFKKIYVCRLYLSETIVGRVQQKNDEKCSESCECLGVSECWSDGRQ